VPVLEVLIIDSSFFLSFLLSKISFILIKELKDINLFLYKRLV
jgi:hypothetical protein